MPKRTRSRTSDVLVLRLCAAGIMGCAVGVRPAGAEWTFGAFLGGASTRPSWIRFEQPAQGTAVTASPVHFRGESATPPLYYGYRVGLFPEPWLGVEGEFIHLKAVADTAREARVEGSLGGEDIAGTRPLSALAQRFSISHGVNLVLLNAVMRKMSHTSGSEPPRWMLTGRVGGGTSVPHPETTVGGASASGYELGAFSAQVAAGVEVRLAAHLYVMAEYKFTRTVQHVAIAGGSARTPLATHHAIAGAVVHVGRSVGRPDGRG